jgi:hypothetical protein
MFTEIREFIVTVPNLPQADKNFTRTNYPEISESDSRIEILEKIKKGIGKSEMCLLAMYVYRQMDIIDWEPFIKAALERNPVCFETTDRLSVAEVHNLLLSLDNISIYDDVRLAQPDEVWNFRRGDGIEKSLLLAAVILRSDKEASVSISIRKTSVILTYNGNSYKFESAKSIEKQIEILGNTYKVS